MLAFELVSTGRVLLFAADAQVGNWLSWQNVQWTMGDKTVKQPQMPFEKLLENPAHRTDRRMIRADDPCVKDPAQPLPFTLPSGSLRAVRRNDSPWVELDIG